MGSVATKLAAAANEAKNGKADADVHIFHKVISSHY
jgi:hypothetical protein